MYSWHRVSMSDQHDSPIISLSDLSIRATESVSSECDETSSGCGLSMSFFNSGCSLWSLQSFRSLNSIGCEYLHWSFGCFRVQIDCNCTWNYVRWPMRISELTVGSEILASLLLVQRFFGPGCILDPILFGLELKPNFISISGIVQQRESELYERFEWKK